MIVDEVELKMAKTLLILLIINVMNVWVTVRAEVKYGVPNHELTHLNEPSGLYDNNKTYTHDNGKESVWQTGEYKMMDNKSNLQIDLKKTHGHSGAREDLHTDNITGPDIAVKRMLTSFLASEQSDLRARDSENAKMAQRQLNKRLMKLALRPFTVLNMVWKGTFQRHLSQKEVWGKMRYHGSISSSMLGRK